MPRNTNTTGIRGCGGRKGIDLGKVTFIQEHVARVEVEASTLGTYSHRMTSRKRTMSQPSEHTELLVSETKVDYYKLLEGQGETGDYILKDRELSWETSPPPQEFPSVLDLESIAKPFEWPEEPTPKLQVLGDDRWTFYISWEELMVNNNE